MKARSGGEKLFISLREEKLGIIDIIVEVDEEDSFYDKELQ